MSRLTASVWPQDCGVASSNHACTGHRVAMSEAAQEKVGLGCVPVPADWPLTTLAALSGSRSAHRRFSIFTFSRSDPRVPQNGASPVTVLLPRLSKPQIRCREPPIAIITSIRLLPLDGRPPARPPPSMWLLPASGIQGRGGLGDGGSCHWRWSRCRPTVSTCMFARLAFGPGSARPFAGMHQSPRRPSPAAPPQACALPRSLPPIFLKLFKVHLSRRFFLSEAAHPDPFILLFTPSAPSCLPNSDPIPSQACLPARTWLAGCTLCHLHIAPSACMPQR